MAKNASNGLKLVPNMYSYGFDSISENVWKFSKFADFPPKNSHLARFLRRENVPFFSTENLSGPSKIFKIG